MNGKFFLGFVSLLVIIFGTIVWADTDGVWHEAEDVRGGTFGSDEQDVTIGYTFVNPVTVNTAGGRGLFSTSSVDDGVGGVTSAAGKSAVYGWANNPASYSGYFEGGKFVVGSGNVGIGTANPEGKLHIHDTSAKIVISDSDLSSPTNGWKWLIGSGYWEQGDFYITRYLNGNLPVFRVKAAGDVLMGGPSTNTLSITMGNNVGIGTVTPTEKLDINGNMRIRGRASCAKLYTDASGNVLCGADAADTDWVESAGNVYRLSGNVGIGRTPVTRLDVNGDTRLYGGVPGSSPKLYFGSETDANAKAIYMASYWMNIKGHGNEGVRIIDNTGDVLAQFNGLGANNGYVGIGTATPSQKLDVNGNVRIRGKSSCEKLYTDASGNVLCGTDAVASDWKVMYLENFYFGSPAKATANCPGGWTEADFQKIFQVPPDPSWSNLYSDKRTCYTNNNCEVMYLEVVGFDPAPAAGIPNPGYCPGGWTEADYQGLSYTVALDISDQNTYQRKKRTCYICS